MSSFTNITSITSATAGCFYFAPNQTRTEVTGDMLREMKNYSPGLLTMFCIVNIFLGFVSFTGNALVVLTTVVFPELHIVANVGLASLATASLLHGSVLNSFLFAVGVNALAGGCPILRSSRFVASYVSYVLIYSFILSLCTVTAERFIGVVFSLRYHAILSIKRMVKFLAACWTVSFLLGVPYNISTPASQTVGKVLWVSIITFALVFSFYCNVKIFCISRKHKRRVISQAQVSQQIEVAKSFRGASTVLYILVTLFLCFLPATLIRCIQARVENDKVRAFRLLKPWTSSCFVMYSAISPFVYFFRCRKLRKYSAKLLRKASGVMGYSLRETDDRIVSATFSSLAIMVPILGANVVFGGKRRKYNVN